MKLHKLKQIVELFRMYRVQQEDFLFWILDHGFVEAGIFDKDLSLYLVLFTIFSLNNVDLITLLHLLIISDKENVNKSLFALED